MAVVGIGTDIVEIERLNTVFQRHGEQFQNRILTEKELELAAARHHALEFYAGRWAAKEACAKALGCGIGAKYPLSGLSTTYLAERLLRQRP